MSYCQRSEEQRKGAWDFLEALDVDIAILQETKPSFEYSKNRNIIFNSLSAKDGWGSSIISKKYNTFKHSFFSCYEGSPALLCYDFLINEDNAVTIINLYGIIDSNGYCTTTVHHMLSDITPVVWEKQNELIVMAGNLNTSAQWDDTHKLVFDRISDMGFSDCTKEQFGESKRTLIRDTPFPYQDDYIFIKGQIHKKWKIKIYDSKKMLNYSDHFPIELTIEL
jgi:endonuclease/exonuclease/phosphatase family metal-dependent hydrolase